MSARTANDPQWGSCMICRRLGLGVPRLSAVSAVPSSWSAPLRTMLQATARMAQRRGGRKRVVMRVVIAQTAPMSVPLRVACQPWWVIQRAWAFCELFGGRGRMVRKRRAESMTIVVTRDAAETGILPVKIAM